MSVSGEMMIRAADNGDISRIAEILVFNNRINFCRYSVMRAIPSARCRC